MHPEVVVAVRRISGRIGRAIIVAFVLAYAGSLLAAQDVISIGAAGGNGGGYVGDTIDLPVYLLDARGTALGMDAGAGKRIQGVAFRITCSPASTLSAVNFSRAGVLASLTPLYEKKVTSAGAVAYAVSFAESSNPVPFNQSAASPGDRIGTLSITIASGPGPITISIAGGAAALSSESGSVIETTVNGRLATSNSSLGIWPSSTTTTLSASPNPGTQGMPVTISATVNSTRAGTITGNVSFADNGRNIGTATVTNGVATLTLSTLLQGTHPLTATYGGDKSFWQSTSSPMNLIIQLAPFGAPLNFQATAASSTTVSLSWIPVTGAVAYEVLRTSGGNTVSLNFSGATMSLIDPVSTGTTYFYRIRAFDGSQWSELSMTDAATTLFFTEDPLVAGSTLVRLTHLTQLREAVNSYRAGAGLQPLTFTDPSIAAGAPVKAAHIEELRLGLNAARAVWGLPAIAFATPATAGNPIKADHLQSLRESVK